MHNGADAPRGCLPIAWQLASSICVRFTPPPLPPHMQQVEVEEETYHKYMFHMHSFQLLYRAEVLEAFPNLATVVVNLEQQDVSPPPRRAQVMRLVNPFSNQDIHPPPLHCIPLSAHRSQPFYFPFQVDDVPHGAQTPLPEPTDASWVGPLKPRGSFSDPLPRRAMHRGYT